MLTFKVEILQTGEMAPLIRDFAEPHRKQDMVAPVYKLSTEVGLGTEEVDFWSSLASQSSPVDELQVQWETLIHKIWWRMRDERYQC